jgi:hypothetical protein
MLLFLVFTFLALVVAAVLHARRGVHGDDSFAMYEKLREGLPSPEENILLIERIANSSDPKKEERLRAAAHLKQISFAEAAAVNAALDDIKNKRLVKNLKERVRAEELQKIQESLAEMDDPLRKTILVYFKYWRYVNRKDHRLFDKINQFIGMVMVEGFTPEAMQLSKELQAELG